MQATFCPKCACSTCITLGTFSCPKCTCPRCAATDDTDYISSPKRKANSAASPLQPTPKKRIKPFSSTSSQAKALTNAAAMPNLPPDVPRYCLLSMRFFESDSLQTCHVIPRSLSFLKVSTLEVAWNIPFGQLNLDSRYNLINLTSELHVSFDNAFWTLVPWDIHLLRKMKKIYVDPSERTKGTIKDYIGPMVQYSYVFFPFPAMQSPISRRDPQTWAQPPTPENPDTIHYLPYQTMPKLMSHVPPHFFIHDFGSKVRRKGITDLTLATGLLSHPYYKNFIEKEPFTEIYLTICLELYDIWLQSTPSAQPSIGIGTQQRGGSRSRGEDNGGSRGGQGSRSRYPMRQRRASQGGSRRSLGGSANGPRSGGLLDAPDALDGLAEGGIELDPADSITCIFGNVDGLDLGGEDEIQDDEECTCDEDDAEFYDRIDRWIEGMISGNEKHLFRSHDTTDYPSLVASGPDSGISGTFKCSTDSTTMVDRDFGKALEPVNSSLNSMTWIVE